MADNTPSPFLADSESARNLDAEQLALDLEDAERRLDLVRVALEAEQRVQAEIAQLERCLRDLRRQLKEARWEVANATRPIRRSGRPKE